MAPILKYLNAAEAQEELAELEQRTHPLPFHKRPQFLEYSAAYLEKNDHNLRTAGFFVEEIRPLYARFADDNQAQYYLPLVRLQAEAERMDLIPAPTVGAAVFPRAPAQRGLEQKVLKTLRRGDNTVWMQKHSTGWNLTHSLLTLFASFSQEQRRAIAHNKKVLLLREQDWSGKTEEMFYDFCTESVSNKAAQGVTIINRDHDLLQKTFPEEVRLTSVECQGETIGVIAWAIVDGDAALIEMVGNRVFRQDDVLPRALFEFLHQLKQRDIQRLQATLFDWVLAPIWAALAEDNRQIRTHLTHVFSRLVARGLEVFEP